MTTNLRAVPFHPYTFPHLTPVRPSVASCATQDEPSTGTPGSNIALVECGICHTHAEPATWCHDSEVGEYAVCALCKAAPNGRRMIAVTVALSEPFDATPELDWAATVASVLRLTYANTTVEVIDSWRVDQ